MAETGIPHFHNQSGVAAVQVGAKEFMCIGAKPPFDHPHVFLDMGSDTEMVCPYCSTLFKYEPSLAKDACNPPDCAYHETAKAA